MLRYFGLLRSMAFGEGSNDGPTIPSAPLGRRTHGTANSVEPLTPSEILEHLANTERGGIDSRTQIGIGALAAERTGRDPSQVTREIQVDVVGAHDERALGAKRPDEQSDLKDHIVAR